MTEATRSSSGVLRRVAGRYGVQVAYRSVRSGGLVQAPARTLVAILRALGAPLEREEDAPDALRAFDAAASTRVAEPAAVAWDGLAPTIPVRLPGSARDHGVRFELLLEDGSVRRWDDRGSIRGVRIAGTLPSGIHRLHIAWRGGRHTVHLISSPRRLIGAKGRDRRWGVFLPLFAARSDDDWGGGTLTQLRLLLDWTAERGGSVVSTLPLFATYLDEPFDPSPYAPVSRLFWNEFYLDPTAMEEFHASAEAKRIASLAEGTLGALRRATLVDWRAAMAVRRKVFETLSEEAHRRHGGPPPDLAAFAREEPELDHYARFRATTDTLGRGWRSWRLHPSVTPDPAAVRYHRWVQWRFERSLGEIAGAAKGRGAGLYLDLPLGVHGEGFDPWRWPGLFADGAAGGAPPDHYSARGQEWGFPPLHPQRVREDGYHYFRSCVRRLARHAAVLRLDHVMSLHRLWWVPSGAEPSEGAYVRYRAEEFYAVVCLEASRAGLTLVGEDLGTVPSEVRSSLGRHGLHRTWAVQRALSTEPRSAFSGIPTGAVASFNTHDHPTFAGWWNEGDLDDRVRLGFLEASGLRRERARRARGRAALMRAVGKMRRGGAAGDGPGLWFRRALPLLGASRADLVLVNLEDLWGETRPQNVPGTTRERPNWRRRARRTIRQIMSSATVRDALGALDMARRKKEAK